MKVWMRGFAATFTASQAVADVLLDGPREAGDARSLDLAGDRP